MLLVADFSIVSGVPFAADISVAVIPDVNSVPADVSLPVAVFTTFPSNPALDWRLYYVCAPVATFIPAIRLSDYRTGTIFWLYSLNNMHVLRWTTISATVDPCRQCYELLHGQERFTTISANINPCRQFYELLHGQERFTTISANFDPRRQLNELLRGQERFMTISATIDPS